MLPYLVEETFLADLVEIPCFAYRHPACFARSVRPVSISAYKPCGKLNIHLLPLVWFLSRDAADVVAKGFAARGGAAARRRGGWCARLCPWRRR
jgi:hypothetical protein